MIVPVILSGGEGKRLWPLSLPSRPKQFLALTGPESLLQQTLRRLSDPARFSAPIIIGGLDHRFLLAEQVRDAGLSVRRMVLEPVARNTAPAAAVGALLAQAADPDALMLLAPADHTIPDTEAFAAAVMLGAEAARAGALVLFGLKPSFPATGYGYIGPGEPIIAGVRKVARFVEKPAEAAARKLVEAGYLWNSGIFLLPAARLIAELEALAPEVIAAARAALDNAEADADFLRLDAAAFAASPSISLDHAVMEKTAHAAVVEADFAWSDIGSWSALWEALDKDGAGNVVRGRAVLEAASGCLVHAEGLQVAALGVSDLIVVATAERVLVIAKDQDQQLRRLVELASGA
ncbi:MAG: mannose-1-phosphate guanylyltransferase/mannose-6-phosphate isomerase [Caulobacteraceae bacterium]|nr:mannose-1-phosphate guanylyltransferase/mannose-6-phosphate isomerase [Caulobacteraceae bacterium]